jgi:hypothetical protein
VVVVAAVAANALPVEIHFEIRRFARSKNENAVHGDADLPDQLLADAFTRVT